VSLTLIYLHGFLSSPLSAKATLTRDWLARHHPAIAFAVPALPDLPQAALAAAEAAVVAALARGRVGLIGSSMGGFHATVLAERYDLRAVLVNPSAQPHLRIHRYFSQDGKSEQTNPYTGQRFTLDENDARWLENAQPAAPDPRRYWLLVQTGDEVLDYREAVAYYAGCRQTIEPGGNHQFAGFERYLPEIVEFLCEGERG
jgi:predicted esterase YcpF (UPF0227 family)